MTRTHELRMQPQGLGVLPALGGGALILVVIASLVLALHPTAGRDLYALYLSLRASGQLSAFGDSVLRASIAAGCASATIYVLVAFGRGVQNAPFLWLSPVLLGFGMAVMMRMRVAPALPMPEVAYYVLSALILLGGGAFLQRRGTASAFAGTLLMLVPLITLAGGYTQRAGAASKAWQQLSAGAAMHAFVLLVLTVGLSFIAVSTRPEPAPAPRARRRYGRHAEGDAIEEALEQARISELRVQAAEERVAVAQTQLRMQAEELESALAIQEDLRAVTPRRVGMRLVVATLVVLAVFGAFMAAFMGLYRPLQLRAAGAQALATHLQSERDSITRGFDTERGALLADLEKARTMALQAEANAEKLQAALSAITAVAAADPAAAPVQVAETKVARTEAAPAAAEPRANKSKARRASRAAARAKAKASQSSAREPREEARPAARNSEPVEVNDDPIAGLDL